MVIMGQLQPGVVEIVKPGTTDVIGYAFTMEDGNGGQLQRWILYEDPQNALEIRPAPGKEDWDLDKWKANVNGSLKQGWNTGSIYVWAQAKVYVHGGTYNGVTWGKAIPSASSLPQATYPPEGAEHMQLDFRTQAIKIQQVGNTGIAFTVGSLSENTSVEYWALSPSYVAAGGSSTSGAVTSIATGTDPAESLQDFINLANKTWTPGSRFVITGCVNYRGADVPRVP